MRRLAYPAPVLPDYARPRASLLAACLLGALSCATAGAPEFELAPSTPAASETAHGIVFEDLDRNGVRDPGEPGIPGVRVSNGLEIASTDQHGRYALPVDEDTILFVIKPRDWMTPVDENHVPRFYYVHKPAGSPGGHFLYRGVAPTGPLPDSVDFPLVARPEPDRFRVVVFADPQPYTEAQLGFFARDTVAELIGFDAALGVSLGDLVGNDLDLLEPLNEVQGLIGIPWYNVIGNHDMNFLSPDDAHSDETYERIYGPPSYAFEYGPVHFVVLDDVIWDGFTGFNSETGRPENDNYRGGFRDDQLDFLERYLETVPTDRLVVLLMHIPLAAWGERQPDRQDELLNLLSTHPHTLSLAGHTHTQYHLFLGAEDGYAPAEGTVHHHIAAPAASGSRYAGARDEVGLPHATMRDGSPNGYSIVTFDGPDYRVRFKANRRPADYQIHLEAPVRVARKRLRRTQVFVNVFAGSEKSQVEMRVAGHSRWKRLRRVVREDPAYRRLLRFERATEEPHWRELPPPRETRHLWVGALPRGLPRGAHAIEVRSTDMFGATHRALRPLLVD
ncbi:MAG: calcineurin-like phosphoesterase C-terminal domain-containing protein [Proteobacteria bacterium]|nr:calcineurin-like phosphoesterase C-terminal domain-containing protein [Pseudomonadota bacterium]